MNEDTLTISNKFNRVDREIERLRVKIHLKKGAWFFNLHVYSTQGLIESEHYDKIYAICSKIEDDILNWFNNGKLSEEGLETYRKGREDTLRKLRAINKEIEYRIPTLLEGILGILNGFVIIISTVLPTIGKVIKTIAGLLGVNIPKQLVAASIKLLQAPNENTNQINS